MAEEMLNGLMGKYEIEVNKIDITSNDVLYELYRFDIPVLSSKAAQPFTEESRKKTF